MEGEKEEEEEDSLKIFTKEERCWCKKIMNIEYLLLVNKTLETKIAFNPSIWS